MPCLQHNTLWVSLQHRLCLSCTCMLDMHMRIDTPVKECNVGLYVLQRKADWLRVLLKMLVTLPEACYSLYNLELLHACLTYALGMLSINSPAFVEQVGPSHAHRC